MTYSSQLKGSGGSPKRGGRSVSLLLALLAVIVALAAFNWLQNRSKEIPSTATLTVVSGEATVSRADAGSDPALRPGEKSTLQRGDQVSTGEASKAKLTFGSGETIELGSNARLSILDLHQSATTKGLEVKLALHQGQSLTQIRHVLFQGMRFEIETSVATVSAHGTIFRCDVIDKDHVYVEVLDGIVQVAMGEQTVDLETGQAVNAYLGQPLQLIGVVQTNLETPALDATDATPTMTDMEKTRFPAAATPTRPGDNDLTYTVATGDTLYSIARKFNVSWETIFDANRDQISSPEMIRVGQELRIPQ